MKNNFERRLLRLVEKVRKKKICTHCGFNRNDVQPVFISELPLGSKPPGKCEYCGYSPPVFFCPDGTLPVNEVSGVFD